MKNNFWLFIIGAIVLLGGAFLFINWAAIKEKVAGGKDGNPGGTGGNGGTGSGSGNSGTGNTGLNYNLTLKKGVYNSPEVAALQRGLNKLQTANPIDVDEDFGQMTEAKLYAVTNLRQITLGQFYLLYPGVK